jgi:hypothetical protein
MSDDISFTFSARERATVLAALAHWRDRHGILLHFFGPLRQLATGDECWNALDDDEIEALAARLIAAKEETNG